MFNDKLYSEVNREERHYCFLFAHALLMSKTVRKGFDALTRERLGIVLDPSALEVYVEAASLRDYWYDFGKPANYTDEIDSRRRKVVETILEEKNLSTGLIMQHDLFWTKSVGSKLWYPSHWNVEELNKAGLKELVEVKWAFNAKPDIMLMTGDSILVIEAKLESGEGCKTDRENDVIYQQLKIQALIIELWKLLIPCFQNKSSKLALLDIKGGDQGIAWSEIIELIEKSDVDDFTQRSMDSLKRRYYPKKID